MRHGESTVRAEGYTELLGEIRLDLSGIVPGMGGLIHVDVMLRFDTNVSGRLNPDGYLDASLTSTSRGTLAKGRMIDNNGVLFERVILGPGGSAIEEGWRINGIRVDATLLHIVVANRTGHVHALVEMISADPDRPRAVILREDITLEAVKPGMHVGILPLEPTLLTHDGTDYRLQPFRVAFQSAFPEAFKTKAQESGDGTSPADQGTVCLVNLSNIPSGVRVFTTLHEIEPTGDPPMAAAVSTDPDGRPNGLLSEVVALDWKGEPMVEVTTASTAAWEIISEVDRSETSILRFGFYVLAPASRGPFAIRVNGALGPYYQPIHEFRSLSDRVPIPRFMQVLPPVEIRCDAIALS